MQDSFESRLQTVCFKVFEIGTGTMYATLYPRDRVEQRYRQPKCENVSQEKLNSVIGRIRYRRIRYDMHKVEGNSWQLMYLCRSVDDSRLRREEEGEESPTLET